MGVPFAGHDFALLADLLKEAMLLVTEAEQIQHANPAAQRLLQRSSTDLTGAALAGLVESREEDRAELIRRALRSSHFSPGALTLRLHTGELLPCRCDVALLRERSGHEPALIVLRVTPKRQAASEFIALREKIRELTKEISGRRMAEEALRQISERYKVTLKSIADAVIATDNEGRIDFMNGVAEELTGWRLEDALERHLDDVFVVLNEDSKNTVESPVAKVLRAGAAVGLANHTLLVRRDGSQVPIDDSGAPIIDAWNRVLGVVLVFRDLTQRHALERELMAKNVSLEEADHRRNEFLSMLAHELRNPLAPVRTGIEILRRRSDTETVQRLTLMMGRQIDHMVRLVDELLDVSRVTKGKIELRLAPVQIGQLLFAAQEMVQPVYDQAGVHLKVNTDFPNELVNGDLTRLVQALVSLLSNAAKFSLAGQEVFLRADLKPDLAVISVVDLGVGIAAASLPKIFDLFYQEHQALDRERGGLGLGLTIARTIVEMHGGVITAHSNGRGQGSTFVVQLPLMRPC